MIALVLRWLTGGGIAAIGEQLNRAHEARLKAQNDHERLEADKTIEEIKGQRDILLSQYTPLLDRLVRPMFALPIAFYFGKVILWDKALGLGSTPDLSERQWQLAMLIAGAYFGAAAVERLFGRRR